MRGPSIVVACHKASAVKLASANTSCLCVGEGCWLNWSGSLHSLRFMANDNRCGLREVASIIVAVKDACFPHLSPWNQLKANVASTASLLKSSVSVV